MQYSPAIEKAIQKAAILHEGQRRKGSQEPPYVTHLFAVAAILSGHTDDEEVIIAGLLHDTLEDTDYTKEELQFEFGERVAAIVAGVTIPTPEDGEKSTWVGSRERYIENLKNAPKESLLVSGADKIHNFLSVLDSFTENPEEFRKNFHGSIQDRIAAYTEIVETITVGLPEHTLSKELHEVFKEYRQFLEEIKKL